MLTRDQILAADDLPRELVKVPEWGGDVYVKTITGAERDRWEIQIATSSKKPSSETIRAALAAMTVCDENNRLLFTQDDIEALSNKSAAPLDRVFQVAMRLNHISQSAVEELEKN